MARRCPSRPPQPQPASDGHRHVGARACLVRPRTARRICQCPEPGARRTRSLRSSAPARTIGARLRGSRLSQAEESWRVAARIKVALLIEAKVFASPRRQPEAHAEDSAAPLIPVLSPAFWQDPDVRWLTGDHEAAGHSYFVKESYEELLWWLQLPALCKLAAQPVPARSRIQEIAEAIMRAQPPAHPQTTELICCSHARRPRPLLRRSPQVKQKLQKKQRKKNLCLTRRLEHEDDERESNPRGNPHHQRQRLAWRAHRPERTGAGAMAHRARRRNRGLGHGRRRAAAHRPSPAPMVGLQPVRTSS